VTIRSSDSPQIGRSIRAHHPIKWTLNSSASSASTRSTLHNYPSKSAPLTSIQPIILRAKRNLSSPYPSSYETQKRPALKSDRPFIPNLRSSLFSRRCFHRRQPHFGIRTIRLYSFHDLSCNLSSKVKTNFIIGTKMYSSLES
jgi:hypothetical protein